MRLKHLNNFRDIEVSGEFRPYPAEPNRRLRVAGRHLRHVNKSGGGCRMVFIFALGKHIVDIRDLAHAYCAEVLPHLQAYTGELAPIVVREIMKASEPHLKFPRLLKVR